MDTKMANRPQRTPPGSIPNPCMAGSTRPVAPMARVAAPPPMADSPERSTEARRILAPSVLPINLDPATLANDAYDLQAQLDLLAVQADQMKLQLRRAQKLASLGTTAAMIAHEFNNLFTPVVAYAQHAVDSGDVELMRKALTTTLTQARLMREMADRVIGMARQQDEGLRPVVLLQVAEHAVGCLCRDLGKDNIGLNLQIDPELKVRANDSMLTQVLFNLVLNARQAMLGRRGRLTIDATPFDDGMVEINVRDTGCGIPPEHLNQIFEPFFSTRQNASRPDQKGLGLGLSICREIIQELNGTITVDSKVDIGTTFTITIPRAE